MLKFSFLILFLFLKNYSSAQNNYTALITDPQIGSQENANNLIHAVDDINKRKNVSRVIVLGNITANGKFDEFIWAQEILDGLNVPYFVVGGEKDYLQSEGNGSEISTLWGDDKKIFYDKDVSLICINTFISEFQTKNHVEPETLTWIYNVLPKTKSKRIITFSYFPLSKTNNNKKLFESFLNYKLFSFVSKAEKLNNEIPSTEGLYLNRKNDWGYLLISVKKDSISIKKILGEEEKKKSTPEIIKSSFANLSLLKSFNEENTFSTVKLLWSVDFEKSISSAPIYFNKKIFAVFKNGTIICFNSPETEKWNYESNSKILIKPFISSDQLIVATTDGDILILNKDTGPPVQTIGIGETITGMTLFKIGESENEINAVVAVTESGKLYCYNLQTLEVIWTNEITDASINSSIVYFDNKIFFQDNEGTLYCLAANNGLLIWKISSTQGGWKNRTINNFITCLHVVDKNLFLMDANGNLFCIDALLGLPEWNIKNIDGIGIIRVNNKSDLIIPTGKNKILTVSIKTKRVIDEIELSSVKNMRSITDLNLIDGNILIGSDDGCVYYTKSKQKPEKIFCGSSTAVVSLINIEGNCLVTDYDGNFTLLKISSPKK